MKRVSQPEATSRGVVQQLALSLALVLVALFLSFVYPPRLAAQSYLERDDFAYIVQLYYASDAYLNEVKQEIAAFHSKYPTSQYIQYLDYLDANVALKMGEYDRARYLYQHLLKQDLHPDILADAYLNYAISSYYLADYPQTMKLLNDLEQTTANPYYLYQIHVWRGRIYAGQGFYLSAEQEYKLALAENPREVHLDYFLVLLELDRHDEAAQSLQSIPPDDPQFNAYNSSWLNYLLAHGDYTEFDEQVALLQSKNAPQTSELSLLRVRKALETEDYPGAKALLDSLGAVSERKTYYQALVIAHDGAVAEADSLFRQLTLSNDSELAVLAYLERLKLMFRRDPDSAILQLESFLGSTQVESAEAFYLLGDFYFRQGRYLEAVSSFVSAIDYPLTPLMADRIDDQIAQSYYQTGEFELCSGAYNRYLNRQTEGRFRDKAFYYLGLINFTQNEYHAASLNFNKVISEYPTSEWVDEARFYKGEIHFLNSEYAQAAELYKGIVLTDANYPLVLLRLAQIYYYQDKYPEAIQLLESIPKSDLDFDAAVLLAGIRFSQKDYARALAIYEDAVNLATSEPQRTELKSYRAYTLFYLKRYNDASLVFYDLSRENLNADIYLYQAAKSAANGKQWTRALDLYDQFVDEFPQSPYFLQVLAEIANIQYNLGRYAAAYQDWLNLLRRFTANTYVSETDLSLLGEVFTGIELCARQLNDSSSIAQLVEMVELFRSDYIKFELEYIIVKLYAGLELWDELLQEAAEVRKSLNLPPNRRNDIEMLMAQSLINLNQLEQADSLVSQVYASTQSHEALIRLAEIASKAGNVDLALERYISAWEQKPSGDLWLRMAELSADSAFLRFPEIWSKGTPYLKLHPQTRLFHIQYLFEKGDELAAGAEADSILASEPNPWLRANAEYYHGLISWQNKDYPAALRSFRKIRLLNKELPDIYLKASYHYILCLLKLSARQEALLTFEEVRSQLSDAQVQNILVLLQGEPEGR